MKTFNTIREIKANGSVKVKAQLLEDALSDLEEILLPILFDIGLNYKINTFITKFNQKCGEFVSETKMVEVVAVLQDIHNDLKNGKRYKMADWDAIYSVLSSLSTKEDMEIIESVLTKDFTVGLAVKSYNKVASKLKKPEIPFYDTMRVSSINDADIDYEKGAYVGIKKDGVNATVERNANIVSRNGQIICLSHVEEIVLPVSNKYVVFGELVSTTRQSSSGLVNSAVKLQYASKLPIHELALHVFDAIHIDEYESRKFVTPFKDRIEIAKSLVEELGHPLIQFVEQTIVYSKEEALIIYEEALKKGEEGIVVNDADSLFEIKRSKLRARVKAEETAEVLIIGTTVHNKQPNWIGSLTVISADGVQTDVGSGLTEEMMKEFFINSPINRVITICYNMVIPNQSGDGWTFFLPTIGKDKSLRFDKDEIDNVIPKEK